MDAAALIVFCHLTMFLVLPSPIFSRKVRTSSKHRSGTSIDDVIGDVCMPKHTDRLVYRFQNKTHVFIGFDIVKKRMFYQMAWKMKENNPGQQRIFQKRLVFCQQSVFTKTCLMEAFADSARKMKQLRFGRKC